MPDGKIQGTISLEDYHNRRMSRIRKWIKLYLQKR
jgi:hypothetical protein